jgi:hypothetical protein
MNGLNLKRSAFAPHAGYIRGVLYSLKPNDRTVYYHWFDKPGFLNVLKNRIIGTFGRALKWTKDRGFLN